MKDEIGNPSVCPHCQKHVGSHFDVHEVLMHPDKRARLYPPEYIEWKAEQDKSRAKKKKKT